MKNNSHHHHHPQPTMRRLRPRPEPIRLPSPALIRLFMLDLLNNQIELLMFACLQHWVGMRCEEAYAALSDPWRWIVDDRFYVPTSWRSRSGRLVRVCPAAWAWLNLVPEFAVRTRTDFRVFRNGRPVTAITMQRMLNSRLRAAGLEKIPKEVLRKTKMTAAIACGVPKIFVMQEAGCEYVHTLHRHVDCFWSREMGLAFFSNFPTDEPHQHAPFDLYRAAHQCDCQPNQ